MRLLIRYERALILKLSLLIITLQMGFAQQAESDINLEYLLPSVDLFELVEVSAPVIGKGTPGTGDNKYGLEGGCAFIHEGAYHLFSAERHDDPLITAMRLGHWKSEDRIHWERISTLVESSADFTGKDIKASIWSPMPVFNDNENRWNLFYVMYQSKPDEGDVFYRNYNGRVMRAVSRTRGYQGIGGPYKDKEIIMEPGEDSDEWEGLQGTDSFFPFQVGDTWYGFYGSAQTQAEKNPLYPHWAVGLAVADELQGPWKRWSEINPVRLHEKFAENPVVTSLGDSCYIAVVDSFVPSAFAYSYSKDGKTWTRATPVDLSIKIAPWWTQLRTPLGLIEEEDGSFTVFFTAFTEGGLGSFASVGYARLKLK